MGKKGGIATLVLQSRLWIRAVMKAIRIFKEILIAFILVRILKIKSFYYLYKFS
ncbi:hypothetical protein KL86SPO_70235 [uncultured Sporomusa sp.]|uniref:Uncharacterized protein n=1 Tax=uncultured Sporomusa sp. TaxID=307249 RepID=A0A212M0W7_9FIRM|nr:hypothetical protein KL86SPO_70235 [uncultured Sporomusa sp.]